MDTPSSANKLAEPAITNYLAYLAKEGEVKQVFFFLVQHAAKSCLIPKSLRDVTRFLANIQKKQLKSCLKELKLLRDRNVYKVVNLSKKRKIIKNHQVFNIKFDNYCRSQLVEKGFSQVKGINFDKLFSSVIYYETTHLFLAITVLEDQNIHSINVKAAYLYSNLDKEIYIEQPEGFRLPGKEKKVQQLHKTLYSLKQASLFWWQTITKSMLALEFKQCKSNSSMYYFIDKKTKELVITIIYIDDVCFMSSKNSLLLLKLK